MTPLTGSHEKGRPTSAGELVIAVALLAVLPLLAAALVLTRGRDGRQTLAELLGADAAEEVVMQPQYAADGSLGDPAEGRNENLVAVLPRPDQGSPFRISTPAQYWLADKMYEKINGEDIVYLDAGCEALAAMTVSLPDDTESIDLYLFRMKTPAAAAKVLAEQAPEAGPADLPSGLDLADEARVSYGSWYVRSGPFYLKVIVNGESPTATDTATNLASKFARAQGGS